MEHILVQYRYTKGLISMIKRLFILIILIAMIILNVQTIFAIKEKFPDDKINEIPVIELEPTESYSFNEYKKDDVKTQKEYSGEWSTLYQINLIRYQITSISSSDLGKSYKSSNLYDGKQETAWVPGIKGAKGSGIGEWVKIKIDAYGGDVTSTPFSIREACIIPGYAKNEKTWIENNRIKSLLLVIYSPPLYYPVDPEWPEWVILRLKLKDQNKLQWFKIPEELIVSNDNPMTKTVWIKIEEVYKGMKYDDTCISELVLSGGCSN